jgi:hypothetical protein
MSDTSVEEESPAYYCDQCGRRYLGPGVCEEGHAPAVLKPVGGTVPTVEVPAPVAVGMPAVEAPVTVEGVPVVTAADPVAPDVPAAAAAESAVAAVTADPSVKDQVTSALQTAVEHLQSALDAIARL